MDCGRGSRRFHTPERALTGFRAGAASANLGALDRVRRSGSMAQLRWGLMAALLISGCGDEPGSADDGECDGEDCESSDPGESSTSGGVEESGSSTGGEA